MEVQSEKSALGGQENYPGAVKREREANRGYTAHRQVCCSFFFTHMLKFYEIRDADRQRRLI